MCDPDEVVSEELLDLRYRTYLEERKTLVDHEHSLDKTLATILIAVSGSALGFSITMMDNLVLPGMKYEMLVGVAAWLTLIIGILVSVFGVFANQQLHLRFREILDEEIEKDLANGLANASNRQGEIKSAKKLRKLNHWSLGLCIAGVIQLFVFSYLATSHRVNSTISSMEQSDGLKEISNDRAAESGRPAEEPYSTAK
ncbi:MAG: hypothetical protein H6813_06160 [Phycisphaeraceae bacterium]|nr:hypothetical protein [Phycisphaeraceae bacterium]MCB9848054.1 hypothetical protein [Phycisphaeraceae bacterium]